MTEGISPKQFHEASVDDWCVIGEGACALIGITE